MLELVLSKTSNIYFEKRYWTMNEKDNSKLSSMFLSLSKKKNIYIPD